MTYDQLFKELSFISTIYPEAAAADAELEATGEGR
jgi:hypothetical protein